MIIFLFTSPAAKNMQDHGFLLTPVLPYILDFVLIWDNAGQWKPVFSHILRSAQFRF